MFARSHHLLQASRRIFVATSQSRSFSSSSASNMSIKTKRVVRGVVFDMDGTLTVPCIDFADMRRRVGITSGDILEVINQWDEARQQEAYRVIAEIEEEALQQMKVMPGAEELCSLLDKAEVPRALVTRNVTSSVDFFHATHFKLPQFHPALSREWTPFKPDPAALIHIAEQWNVDPTELVMIGDSAKDDIVCGNRAGATTILLDTEGKYPKGVDDDQLKGELRPDFVAKSLHEASVLLHDTLELKSPNK